MMGRILYATLLMAVFEVLTFQAARCLSDDGVIPEQNGRIKKRSYNPWAVPTFNSLSVYNAGKVFRPATRSISPPYYIPIYGAGANYIFYPPQQLYRNPGLPIDNNTEKKIYKAPPYLPPKKDESSTVNRFGGTDDDDAPIWGSVPAQMPLSGSDREKEYNLPIPTRPPPSATLPPRPSLIHENAQTQGQFVRPAAPVSTTSTTTEPLPSELQSGPSNCVWAIISCCSATSTSPPQNCFEQRGCPGPFWGSSPCHSDFARAAIAAAVDYYNRNPAGK